MNFLERFFEEKDIDRYERFDVITPDDAWHSIPYGAVIDAIHQTRGDERKLIEGTLRKIDFKNGDVCHYLRHLGMALAINTTQEHA